MKGNSGGKTNTEKLMNRLSDSYSPPKSGFILLLLLYAIATYFVQKSTRSDGVMLILGQAIPQRSLTGAFSSVANLCLILLVVFYKKPGFIVAIVVLLGQFPSLLIAVFIRRIYTSIPGFFQNLLIILACVLIYNNDLKAGKYQTRLRTQAVTDQLTGLPNRFAASELTDELTKDGTPFAAALINLDHFKNINNMMGEKTGNAVLIEVASRLKAIADQGISGTTDFVACQGADEYLLIIRDYADEDEVQNTLAGYEEAIREKITIDGCDYFLTASIGWAAFPADAENSDALLACLRTALAEAKRPNSRVQVCRFTPALMNADHAIETERRIRTALDENRLFFVLQPQYDISHRLSGFEVLARIREPDGSILGPNVFIPVAEEAGLIDRIDRTVFRDAARFFGKIIQKTHTDITLSVNVSVRHLMKNDFLDEVREILKTSGVPANQLEIEITESIMIDSVENALQCISEIKKMGIKIAIDDFGTGYSSLSYLNTFPADLLKVDKAFIDQMNNSDSSRQYVATIISIGHVMNFAVMSEGVEETEQLETLRSIGCDYIQGFLWGRPMMPEDAEELVVRSVR